MSSQLLTSRASARDWCRGRSMKISCGHTRRSSGVDHHASSPPRLRRSVFRCASTVTSGSSVTPTRATQTPPRAEATPSNCDRCSARHISSSTRGTVVVTEFPGGPAKMYPVPHGDGRGRDLNCRHVERIRDALESERLRVAFTGRLAGYAYLDQDDVIRGALDEARRLLGAS